jgi:ribonucleotide reductase beta subunit family protein with ferritin-like domain
MKEFNSFSNNMNMASSLSQRYTLFPIASTEEDLYRFYKKAAASFWIVEEIDFSKDKDDWNKLTENEQYFIKHVLAFFAGSDGIVQENLASRFQKEVESPVARLFYGMQNAMEGVHSETYSLLIDQYVKDKDEQMKYFRAIDTIPAIRKKAQWAIDWIESSQDFATRLLAFACVEGIFFSGSFCAIYWIKKRGLLPGLTFSNELIARDEGLHTEFAIAMYHKVENKLNTETVHKIVSQAVDYEKEFIITALPCALIGMNANDMSKYIEFVADRLLLQLGYAKLYNSTNPFDFMDLISLEGKTNFFEKKVSDYSRLTNVNATVIKFDEEDF